MAASNKIMEEFGMKAMGMSGLTLLAWEGMWATLFMLALGCPLLWCLPGEDHGHVEDSINTLVMLKGSWLLVWLTLGVQVANAAPTASNILTIKYLDAVQALLLDLLRPAVVWTFGLCVHYLWDK